MYVRSLAAMSMVLATAAPAVAQDSTARPRRAPSPSAESVLRLRQNLELTDQQIAQLDALRREALAARQARMAELMELESRHLAGELSREEWRTEMANRRDAARQRIQERDDRVSAVLTEAQRDRLGELRQALRHRGEMDRAWGRRAPRPGRGVGPGVPPRWNRPPAGRMGPGGRGRHGPSGGRSMPRWRPTPEERPER